MCMATKETLSREQLAGDNESQFLRSTKAHRPIPLKEHTVQLNIARKKHPNRRSKTNLDGLYEVLAPGSVVQKTDKFTSVISETEKLEVTVRNSDIANFGTRDERKTNLTEYINRRGPRVNEKSAEAKILSHTKFHTNSERRSQDETSQTGYGKRCLIKQIQNCLRNASKDAKMHHNLVPPETPSQPETNSGQQILTSEVIFAPLTTNQRSELTLPSTSQQ